MSRTTIYKKIDDGELSRNSDKRVDTTDQHRGKPLRAFFAFVPKRRAIVLCIGDKGNSKRFYREMLAVADQQYEYHLKTLGDLSHD